VDPPLRVREDWWVFEKTLKVKEALVGFSNVKEVLVGFRKTSLALREVFRKPFSSPIF
jgi:hypothetical protein